MFILTFLPVQVLRSSYYLFVIRKISNHTTEHITEEYKLLSKQHIVATELLLKPYEAFTRL